MNASARLLALLCLTTGLLLPGLSAAPIHADTCTEQITDGGFEAGGAWQLGPSPIMPQYVTYARHGGYRSLALGITSGANVESFSSARQTVMIPVGISQATLSFWFYAMADSPATTDYMEVVLLDATGTAILAKPWQSHNDSRLWNQMSFDLTPWRGQTMQIYFNVYNDGLGGKAAMFVDDVSLQACTGGVTVVPTGTVTVISSGTPTGTPPATVTPTATPSCVSALVNGDFSSGTAGWQLPAGGSTGVGLVTSPVRSAFNAVKLGSLEQNLDGLAWIRQLVTIPAGYTQVTLGAWVFTESQSAAGNDYQQIDLLDASGNPISPSSPIWKGDPPQNNPAWQPLSFNLPVAAGQSVFVRFSVFNDGAGGRTDMVVDDVTVTACAPGPGATATATSVPTGTPTPPPTVTGTPPPTWTAVAPGCVELLLNSGFETGWDPWYVPSNPLLPQIVASPVLAGNYAAGLGSQTQNASSYSSVRQWVTVPPGRPRVVLSYWSYTWVESLSGADRQQLVLLMPDNAVLAKPWSVLEDERTWQQHVYDIIGLAGQTFAVYFNVFSDGIGGRTALFVDEVHLWACTTGAYPTSLTLTSAAAPRAAPAAQPVAVGVTSAMTASPDVTRVALEPSARVFAGTAVPGSAADAAGTEQASLLSKLRSSGYLKWLAILLVVALVAVVFWLLRPPARS